MTDTLKVLAKLRDMGHVVQIGPFEFVEKVLETETTFTVLISRAKFAESRGNQRITKRGHDAYQFKLAEDLDGPRWAMTDRITVWWSTDERHERFR